MKTGFIVDDALEEDAFLVVRFTEIEVVETGFNLIIEVTENFVVGFRVTKDKDDLDIAVITEVSIILCFNLAVEVGVFQIGKAEVIRVLRLGEEDLAWEDIFVDDFPS